MIPGFLFLLHQCDDALYDALFLRSCFSEAISKIGFWVKIAAGPCFHAKPDDPSIFIIEGEPQIGGPPEADRRI